MVQLNKERISHNLAVVDKLIVPVIVGVDSLQGNGLTLDFSSTLFKVGSHNSQAKYVRSATLAPSSNQITKVVCLH